MAALQTAVVLPGAPPSPSPAGEPTGEAEGEGGAHGLGSTQAGTGYPWVPQRDGVDILVPPWSTVRVSPHWTPRHSLYLCIQVVGAFLIGGSLNLAIHIPVLRTQLTEEQGLYFWRFPGCLAGDLVITLLATVVLSWFISSFLCPANVKAGRVSPLPSTALYTWPREGTWLYNTAQAGDLVWQSTPRPGGRAQPYLMFQRNLKRSLLFCLPMFALWWTLAVIVCTAVWGNSGYNNWPQPQLIMLVFGGAVSASTTAAVAVCTLVAYGDRLERARAVHVPGPGPGQLQAEVAAKPADAAAQPLQAPAALPASNIVPIV